VDVVTREMIAAPERAPQAHRPVQEPDPERRPRDRGDEPDRNRVEHAAAERPGAEVREPAECEQRPAAIRQHVETP
jgi:hypothetical protein